VWEAAAAPRDGSRHDEHGAACRSRTRGERLSCPASGCPREAGPRARAPPPAPRKEREGRRPRRRVARSGGRGRRLSGRVRRVQKRGSAERVPVLPARARPAAARLAADPRRVPREPQPAGRPQGPGTGGAAEKRRVARTAGALVRCPLHRSRAPAGTRRDAGQDRRRGGGAPERQPL
jgi:hypothetical protein